jgi:hypothetical protein
MMDDSLGQQLAIFGAEAAAAHADRVHGTWSDAAWDFLVRFGQAQKGRPFMAEDVRAHAELRKAVPLPPDNRAWGSIVMRAAKARLIRRVDYAPNKSPSCHGSPKSVWVWVG